MKRLFHVVISAAFLFILAGCGGGNMASNVAPVGATGSGTASFTVNWPPQQRLIPNASQSIVITIDHGSTVLQQQTLKRPSGSGPTTASFNLLPVESLTATATAYPNTNGTGAAQATATVPLTIEANKTIPISITMNSTIVRLVLSPNPATVDVDSTQQMSVAAYDADDSVVLLSPPKLQWMSSNTSLVKVGTTGIATGIKEGSCDITVTDTESLKSASVAASVVPPGNPFLYDGFAYPAGSAVAGLNGGTGNWGGPWNEYGQGETPSVIANGGLSFGNLKTEGNAIMTTSDFPVGHARSFQTSPGKVGPVLFISYLMEPLDSMTAGSPDTYFGLFYGGIATGKGGGSAYYGLETSGGGDRVDSTVLAVTNQTVFIVLRITFGPVNGNDKIDMFINPTPGQPLPAVPDATKADQNTGMPGNFNFGGSIRCLFDEVRFGHTSEDVMPTN